jgi:tRNA U34 5-carboxymethylaminomethyl modifying GTPase MnmE/TrmE
VCPIYVGTQCDIASPSQRAAAGQEVIVTSAADQTGIDELKKALLHFGEQQNSPQFIIQNPITADQQKCC